MTQTLNSGSKDISSYLTAESVDLLSSWYSLHKERRFFDFLLRGLEVPSTGIVVEIGGGAGLQGTILRDWYGDRYLHSDYSAPLVERAKRFGLNSQVIDGLHMPFADGSLAGLITVAVSTIANDESTRLRQFKEFERVLSPNAPAVLITGRLAALRRMHCLNRNDVASLDSLGLKLERYLSWGLIPGKFWRSWNSGVFAGFERVGAGVSIGIRRAIIVRKK